MNWKKWLENILYITLFLILWLMPTILANPYYTRTLMFMLINTLLTVSLWIIISTGQVSLGHAGFAAIGGYLSAALVTSFGLSSWLSLPIAVLAAGIVALILGFITLRISGIYFIMITLALGEIIRIVFGMLDYPFGGLVGIMNVPPPDPIAIPFLPIISFSSRSSLYYVILVFVTLCIAIIYMLNKSPIGLVFRGISQADNLAEHVGINILRYKLLAFVIGSMCASLAGVLYVYSTACILPSSFTLVQSMYYLLYMAVGGGTGIAGPILGTVTLNIMSEFLKPIKEFEPIIYSFLLIGIVLFFRSGLLGAVQTLGRKFKMLIRPD